MMDTDRNIIAEYCLDSEENHIIITHGTDTMVETAKVLAGKSDLKHKTIVFTGAMVPFVFGSSDGLFNLGAAIAYVQILPPGVYVAMNGKHFTYDNVRKNKETGEFERVKDK
jgi:L-asparaginase